MGRQRPLTIVTYELNIITAYNEVKEAFSTSYDSEFYDNDRESTDSIFINMRMQDLKEKYGDDVLLLEYTIERKSQTLN